MTCQRLNPRLGWVMQYPRVAYPASVGAASSLTRESLAATGPRRCRSLLTVRDETLAAEELLLKRRGNQSTAMKWEDKDDVGRHRKASSDRTEKTRRGHRVARRTRRP